MIDHSLSIDSATFVVVDVETTGLSPLNDRITEIAMMKIQNGVLVDEFSTLINPLVPIPPAITAITGIDTLMVQNAPTAREIVPTIVSFLGNSIFVAHNAPFDWGFVCQTALRENNILLTNPILCTVKLSKKILPHLRSKTLGVVTAALGIRIPARHRASGDAYATALLLLKLLTHLKHHRGICTVSELLHFHNS
ncbi:MAG: 3'-5' exonuclease [Bacteroidetes bacterium]|nr:3'-5' exonuclease [Bacteroidota bacterium]